MFAKLNNKRKTKRKNLKRNKKSVKKGGAGMTEKQKREIRLKLDLIGRYFVFHMDGVIHNIEGLDISAVNKALFITPIRNIMHQLEEIKIQIIKEMEDDAFNYDYDIIKIRFTPSLFAIEGVLKSIDNLHPNIKNNRALEKFNYYTVKMFQPHFNPQEEHGRFEN